jgi:hypothetical protein
MNICSVRLCDQSLASLAGAIFGCAVLWAPGGAAAGDAFSATSAITLPGGQKITSFDIGDVDARLGLYALADRTNRAVDVFDTATNTLQVQLTSHFAGFDPLKGNDFAGPNGALFVEHREMWAADGIGGRGTSKVKVIDLISRKTTHVIDTGGKRRADELCYDREDGIILVANDAEHFQPDRWPFVTFISASTYEVLGKITMDGTGGTPKATNGIEQCQWNPRNGLFYLNIPEVNGPGDDSVPGAVLIINPKKMSIKRTLTIPLNDCAGPQGMAIGPNSQILLGCHAKASAVINDDGVVLRSFRHEFGSDEVWFNPGDGRYFLGLSNNTTGGSPTPKLGVIRADRPGFGPVAEQSPPTGTGAHSVAADPVKNQVYVPIPSTATLGTCSSAGGDDTLGCIAVFTNGPSTEQLTQR